MIILKIALLLKDRHQLLERACKGSTGSFLSFRIGRNIFPDSVSTFATLLMLSFPDNQPSTSKVSVSSKKEDRLSNLLLRGNSLLDFSRVRFLCSTAVGVFGGREMLLQKMTSG